MSAKQRFAGIAAAAVALLAGRAAHANGAFPFVNQLVANPDDPDQLVLRGTFGLVVSKDRGKTWDWLCETGMGYRDVLPPIAVLPSGAVLLALPTGISRSDSSWCGFGSGTGIEGQIVDVSAVRAEPGTAIALSVDLLARTSRVWESTDDGASWQPLGAPIENFQATTLDAAATEPDVIYVSGSTVGADADDFLLRSADRGLSWQQHQVPSTTLASSVPYIGAVAPEAIDTVYVRRDGNPGVVLVTRNGGETFDEVLRVDGLVNSLALSPDGSTLLAGNLASGLYRTDTASLEVQHVACKGVTCLSWNEGGLYACGDINFNRFLVGKSLDDGASFDVLLSPSCVRGPLDCDTTTSIGAKCPKEWPLVRASLGPETCTPSTPPPRDDSCLTDAGGAGSVGDSGDAGVSVAGAPDGAVSDAGVPDTDGGGLGGAGSRGHPSSSAGETVVTTEETTTTPPEGNGGCGCSTAPRSQRLWSLACLSALLMLRRRRLTRRAVSDP